MQTNIVWGFIIRATTTTNPIKIILCLGLDHLLGQARTTAKYATLS